MVKFDPPTKTTLLSPSPKYLSLVIMAATPTPVPNLVQIRLWEASVQMGKI